VPAKEQQCSIEYMAPTTLPAAPTGLPEVVCALPTSRQHAILTWPSALALLLQHIPPGPSTQARGSSCAAGVRAVVLATAATAAADFHPAHPGVDHGAHAPAAGVCRAVPCRPTAAVRGCRLSWGRGSRCGSPPCNATSALHSTGAVLAVPAAPACAASPNKGCSAAGAATAAATRGRLLGGAHMGEPLCRLCLILAIALPGFNPCAAAPSNHQTTSCCMRPPSTSPGPPERGASCAASPAAGTSPTARSSTLPGRPVEVP
jgi:hypothetical protein